MTAAPTNSSATLIRRRIEQGGERLWRLEDFRDLPLTAAAQTLSRLARKGAIKRLSKGIYYRARNTAFGESRPNPALLRALATADKKLFPAGIAAASHLGFTTQNPRREEMATTASCLSRKLIGEDALIHTRRPAAWSGLSTANAAILDFLRQGGTTSELPAEETIQRMHGLLSQPGRYEALLAVAETEPPRVRAMLGAFGQWLSRPHAELARLRASLNPLSKFDFGMFANIPHSRSWQAKGAPA